MFTATATAAAANSRPQKLGNFEVARGTLLL